jgi:hypothetical protein
MVLCRPDHIPVSLPIQVPVPLPEDTFSRTRARLESLPVSSAFMAMDILEEFEGAQAWARCQGGQTRFRTYQEEPTEDQVQDIYLTHPQSPSQGWGRLGTKDEEA